MSLPMFRAPTRCEDVRPAVRAWLQEMRAALEEDVTLEDEQRQDLLRLALSDVDEESLTTLLIVFAGSVPQALVAVVRR
jgi:hypothetical protein